MGLVYGFVGVSVAGIGTVVAILLRQVPSLELIQERPRAAPPAARERPSG